MHNQRTKSKQRLRRFASTRPGAVRLCCATAALFVISCATDAGNGDAVGGSGPGAAGSAGASAGSAGKGPGSSGAAGALNTAGSTSAGGSPAVAGSPSTTGGSTIVGGSPSTVGGGAGATSGGSAGQGGSGGLSPGNAGAGGGNGQAGSGQGGTSNAGGNAGNPGAADRAGGGAGGNPGPGNSPPIGKKFVGNIDARNQIRPDFAKYWNQFTPENAGKWDSVERTRDEMDWSRLDAMYAYAKQNNVLVKQHTLVWGRQQPTWLSNLSQAEQRAEVEEWIRLFCERYPDTPLIDVVNEPPPHTTPPYVAALGGAGSSGYDWIAQAFKWARQYCPKSILILNDYNNIEYQADNAHTIDIVNKIKNAGAPIDAVGAQAHDAYMLSTSTVQMYIDRIVSQTGLPVYISEYDIPVADDNQQRSVMQSQFTMFWNHEDIKGITLWGYIVGSTWKNNSGIMSSSGTMRPAMTWLMDFLEIQ